MYMIVLLDKWPDTHIYTKVKYYIILTNIIDTQMICLVLLSFIVMLVTILLGYGQ